MQKNGKGKDAAAADDDKEEECQIIGRTILVRPASY